MRYAARRLLNGLLVLIALSALSFLMAELAPGDVLAEMQLDPQISAETIDTLRARYGLDRPLLVRYWRWLASIARGEWGYSFVHHRPVRELLAPRLLNTLLLTTVATAVAWLLALALGLWSAYWRGGWVDRLCQTGAAVAQSVPELLLALAGLLIAAKSGALPVGGMVSLNFPQLAAAAKIVDVAWHLALPAAILAVTTLPILLQHTRAAILEALEAPFLVSARALGLGPRRLLTRHVLPAAANPLISLFGLSISSLLSSSLVIEIVLAWPGLALLLLDSILTRDRYVVIAGALLSGLLLVIGNLIADLLLYRIDPRLRRDGRAPR